MLQRILLASAALVFAATSLQAQISAPKYSNEFMSIGIGGRALAMGNAQVAVTNDVTAGYWNPAGLLNINTKYNAALMHSELFAGIAKHDYGAFSTPIDSMSHLGFSVIRLGVDDIANTLYLIDQDGRIDYSRISYFSVADYAGLISYARRSRLIEGLQVGANAKIIHRTVGAFANSWGFGVDIGAQLQRKNFSFGLMARDITTTFNAWSYNAEELDFQDSVNVVPENNVELTLPKLIPGIAYRVDITDRFSALAALDVDLTFDGKRNTLVSTDFVSADPHAGLELSYNRMIFVRGGLSNIQSFKDLEGGESWKVQPNFGVGVAVKGLVLDMALSRMADNTSLNSIIVSLGYSFNK